VALARGLDAMVLRCSRGPGSWTLVQNGPGRPFREDFQPGLPLELRICHFGGPASSGCEAIIKIFGEAKRAPCLCQGRLPCSSAAPQGAPQHFLSRTAERARTASARAQLHSVARLRILSSPSAAEHSMVLRCALQHNLRAQAWQDVSEEQRRTCQQHCNGL